jgi:cysteine sulfinate desulfinase/cysteine desulfurase-like protein
MPTYLDCNATTPIEEFVAEAVIRFTRDEYGNAGSRRSKRPAIRFGRSLMLSAKR